MEGEEAFFLDVCGIQSQTRPVCMDAHLTCQQLLKDAEPFPGHPMQPYGPRKIHFWAKEMAMDKNKIGFGYKNEVIYISIVGKDL